MPPNVFIAEISSNHNRDLNRCFEFIKAAKEIGCDAVKFQFFDIANIFHYSILERSKKHSDRKEWELPIEFIPQIANTVMNPIYFLDVHHLIKNP